SYLTEHPPNKLVTKMVTNTGSRAGFVRHGVGAAIDFRKTNQHLPGPAITAWPRHDHIRNPLLFRLSYEDARHTLAQLGAASTGSARPRRRERPRQGRGRFGKHDHNQ